jgi:hypothetical protein
VKSSFIAKFLPISYEEDMNKDEMLRRISELESLNDQLMSELRYLDDLLKKVGFEEGLKTLKFAAQEILDQDQSSA